MSFQVRHLPRFNRDDGAVGDPDQKSPFTYHDTPRSISCGLLSRSFFDIAVQLQHQRCNTVKIHVPNLLEYSKPIAFGSLVSQYDTWTGTLRWNPERSSLFGHEQPVSSYTDIDQSKGVVTPEMVRNGMQ